MAFDSRVKLVGSVREPVPGAQLVGDVPPNETVQVTIILKRRGGDPIVDEETAPLSHDELAAQHGADPDHLDLIERFAHEFGLTVVDTSLLKRRVILSGTAQAMQKAFETDLKRFRIDTTGPHFRGRTGAISIPAELEPAVIAVLGLDTRPVARPHFRHRKRRAAAQPEAAPAGSFTPPQVAAAYGFPTDVNGAGQTVAILELGGGYNTADLNTYFSGLGIKTPNITAVSVDGGQNTSDPNADGEVMLDVEIVGSVAPGANIAVYFAPNTDQGFVDAITDSVHDTTRKPSIVSISWGGPEDSWTQQSVTAMNAALQDAAALGVTVAVACGDSGSTDGVGDHKLHVDFPAASPYVLACGGTTLKASGHTISSETVWNETSIQAGATGGGVSNLNALPSFQANAGVPPNPETKFVGRGTPDVTGNGDPETGYQVRVDGQDQVIGGTSAVAPLWAGLTALLNQKLGRSLGFLNQTLYPLGETGFNDITTGNNDDSGLGYYSAKAGWDPCSGLGSPNAAALLAALQKGATKKKKKHHA